jgi:hypothetical protein
MYLAALVGENLYVSTYFIATADGVGGGGPPTKKPTLKNAGKKAKALNLNRWQGQSTIPHLVSPVTHT